VNGHRPGRRSQEADRGSASIWTAAGIAALFLVGIALLAVGAVAQTRHRAVAAADLAALAAAGDAPDGATAACVRAHWVTDQMRVHLISCRLSGWDALIEVSATLPGALDQFGDATAHSRAGPVDR
jgi:secretion/DNA translocation related TadE-like protein